MTFDLSALGQPLDDRDAFDILADAVEALQGLLPDWEARNGSPEVTFMEALAYAVADAVAQANDSVALAEELLLSSLYEVPRLAGSQATGTLTITFDSTVSLTVPEGTLFLLPDYDAEVAASADATVSADTTLAVAVASVEATDRLNGVDDAVVDVVDSIPNAQSVAVTTGFSGGVEPEDDFSYLARARQRLARVTNSLVVVDHFSAYCLESGLASNAVGIGAWDGVTVGTIGSDAGEVTVVCYGFGGQVSSGDRATLASEMQAITAAGVTVHVNEAGLATVAVDVDVVAEPGEDTSVVQANVEAALTAYLDPETWEFGETVRRTSLIALIAGVDGVWYVDTLTTPAADETTLDADEVAQAGTLTVSVT